MDNQKEKQTESPRHEAQEPGIERAIGSLVDALTVLSQNISAFEGQATLLNGQALACNDNNAHLYIMRAVRILNDLNAKAGAQESIEARVAKEPFGPGPILPRLQKIEDRHNSLNNAFAGFRDLVNITVDKLTTQAQSTEEHTQALHTEYDRIRELGAKLEGKVSKHLEGTAKEISRIDSRIDGHSAAIDNLIERIHTLEHKAERKARKPRK